MPVAGLVAGLAGFLFGFPALRLAGVYLALATFALAVIIPSSRPRSPFTGGSSGMLLALPTSPIGGLGVDTWLYYVTLGDRRRRLPRRAVWSCCTGSGAAPCAQSARTSSRRLPPASACRATRRSRSASAAAYAGIAGRAFAILSFFVTPGAFPITTVDPAAWRASSSAARGSLLGAIVGAVFVQLHPVYSADVLGPVINSAQTIGLPIADVDKTTPGVPSVVYGVILLLVLFLMPAGRRRAVFPHCATNEESRIVVRSC